MKPSKTILIPLKIISIILGISALYFFSQNSEISQNDIIIGGILFLSALSIESILSVFYSRIFCFFIFPAVMAASDIFFFGGNIVSGIFLFLGIFITSKCFSSTTKEKIHFTFFQNFLQALKKGMLFSVLGIFLLISPFSSSVNITEKVQKIAQPMISKLLDEQFSAEKTEKFYAQCQNYKPCIAKVDAQIESEKTKARIQLESELDKTIEKWTAPENIQKFLAEKNIPLPESFDIEILQKILTILFFIILFLPFSFLFALAGGIIGTRIFWVLKLVKIFRVENEKVEQEVLR